MRGICLIRFLYTLFGFMNKVKAFCFAFSAVDGAIETASDHRVENDSLSFFS